MFNLILLLQLLFLKFLHSIQLFSLFTLHKIDLSIATLTNHLQQFEIIPVSGPTPLLVLHDHQLIVLFKHHNIIFVDFFLRLLFGRLGRAYGFFVMGVDNEGCEIRSALD